MLRMSEGWIADAWILTITFPSFGEGLGTEMSANLGGESGDGFVRWRAFIVSVDILGEFGEEISRR